MKIVTFLHNDEQRLGIVTGNIVVPIPHDFVASDMNCLIASWEKLRPGLERIAGNASDALALGEVRLLAPVTRPGKILAIGLNYRDHIAESGLQAPERQVWFSKQSNTVHPPFEPVQIPVASDKVDYEVELVVIIGKRGRHISRQDAASHVFGYCVGNDVSVRDWQLATPQWMLGKSFDTHGPFGPWITTADEIGDPHRLSIKCWVNGELRQSSNTKNLVFDVWDQIAHLSEAMTLEPGDIIYTGTPGGVGWAMTPPQVLKADDVVRCEIEELGEIEHRFVNERM